MIISSSYQNQRKPLPDAPTLHVNLARASAIFEWAALERLQESAGKADSDRQAAAKEACELLITGINQDSHYKEHRNGTRSVRLFDLLATLIFRCGLQNDLEKRFNELVTQVDSLISPTSKRSDVRHQKKGQQVKFRVHRYAHTRFKPKDFEKENSKEPLPPSRLLDKSCWKEQLASWDVRKKRGPQVKSSNKENMDPAGASRRLERRNEEWSKRKEKWQNRNSKFQKTLGDISKRITWGMSFCPKSTVDRDNEIRKLGAEDQRRQYKLNVPLDILAFEIPFLKSA